MGQTVTSPRGETKVSRLFYDPAGTPTEGDVAFVQTEDGYTFVVKEVGDTIYNNGSPPDAFTITSISGGNVTATVVRADEDDGGEATLTFPAIMPTTASGDELSFDSAFNTPAPDPPEIIDPIDTTGAGGSVRQVSTGAGGSNGRSGALFVPPRSGGDGSPGPAMDRTLTSTIDTGSAIGWEIGSVGGKGGNGGNSYASFWDGRRGGDGGQGGNVTAAQAAGSGIVTRGADHHGIFAYSRSGRAGNGGSGYGAPGGGQGGHSANGGSVTVNQRGTIRTDGDGSHGIFALSVSNNGGDSGSQWGLGGSSSAGGTGGNGGAVNVITHGGATILTTGDYAVGILGQSIGGTGGSAGSSSNLIVSLPGSGAMGGTGGTVSITNGGTIETQGLGSHGILAQSLGGSGGSGGGGWGLVALGGQGDAGGSGSAVTVTNGATGSILTGGAGAYGILAQSIGGSGGSGSNAGGLVAIGGDGAGAGSGAAVTVSNLGRIETTGERARGIVAQSIGGGGGDGGNTGGMVSVGGRGGAGGAGGAVSVTNDGVIVTAGDDATGILAQSVGGGGGNGGSAGAVGAFVGVAVGGKGGSGGNGGNVSVALTDTDAAQPSSIRTEGDRAYGVIAQSVGGGGGNGGGAVSVAVGYAGAASVAVGGAGGSGGAGGNVTLTGGGETTIQTGGADAIGVLAQSVGGGGGNGGYAVSLALAGGETVAAGLAVSVGGSGGSGGAGGNVLAGSLSGGVLTGAGLEGSVLTTGERSAGVVLQSVGGGGGNGGLSVAVSGAAAGAFAGNVSVAVGGAGATGGAGGEVRGQIDANVTTTAGYSTGILAQSVGGGGGNGGGSIAGGISGAGAGAGTISVGVGGAGAVASAGGRVELIAGGDNIRTEGVFSTGIIVQSIGGGGGNGGYSVAASAAGAGTGAAAINLGLGGAGGGGGAGGNVTATVSAAVTTLGASSGGVLAQSVGGGGGNGGFNVTAGIAGAGTGAGAISVGLGGAGAGGGNGGSVTATANGTILTEGFASAGFIAQSIGGGGGSGGFNVSAAIAGAGTGAGAISVGLGGSGGGGGNGGTVIATTTGDVETYGDASVGVLAQSVGGGGGSGGFDVSAAGAGAGTGAGAISVGLGGSGAGGGSGGSVTLTVTNDVLTHGAYSGAVIAQSIGGGGGSGGFNVSGAGAGAGTGAAALGVGIGGGGGAGSSGGAVTSHVTGTLVTAGAHSGGLLVQSVGGGGGSGGMNISGALSFAGTGSGALAVGVGGWGGEGGTGGVVGSTYEGETWTAGDWAPGLVAQSIGGGGGNGGMNIAGSISVAPDVSVGVSIGVGGFGGDGGAAGNVTHDAKGHVWTAGADSTGVLTQSLGGGGGNGGMNVSGSVSLAKDAGAAIGIGIGGFGGGGADAGASTQASFTGGVWTAGDRSSAIVTQSIGGGGGNGGINIAGAVNLAKGSGGAATLGLGGFGGGAGNGGAVTSTVTAGATTDDAFVTLGDNSTAILAQSLGGGGGTGGLNVSGAVNVTGDSGASVALGVGGFGGGGGNSAGVTLDVTGNVVTFGDRSDGVVAQSLGGGGGNGGVNISGALDIAKPGGGGNAFSVAIGVGGFGGDGGNSGDVHLGYTGTLIALPRTRDADGNITGVVDAGQASGLIAQSIGGGGGNGGINVGAGVTINNKPGEGQPSGHSYAVLVGLGGFGGSGGDAGNVEVEVGGGSIITAHGVGASGIFAQSVGGGGGNGGLNVSGGIVSDSSLIVGVGGFGGNAGRAGDVSVTASADIHVSTDPAAITDPDEIDDFEGKLRSLFGEGVMNDLANSAIDEAGSMVESHGLRRLFVDLGLLRDDKEAPETEGSAGLLAQSIGGGGGNGGLNVSGGIALSRDGDIPSITFGIGGFGGDANESGNVTVVQAGTIEVAGNWKHGILAQSIAGGGGNGGLNVTGQLNWEGSGESNGATDLSIVAGLGGWGGTGADAGDVSVTSTGDISTNGYHARGIFAQSIGGGGGTGGINVSAVGAQDSSPIAIGVGGFGGVGGDAGRVTVLRGTADAAAGLILTNGTSSHGIEASSIGGGGGDAGVNAVIGVSRTSSSGGGSGGGGGGTDRNVPANTGVDSSVITNYNAVLDELEGRTGTAPSGGGSSNSTNSAVIAVGGSAGNAGNGSAVEVTGFGEIATLGDRSHGIIAQSIGGGGGNAAMNLGLIFELGETGGNKGFGLAVGGAGGEGGTGGTVDVANTGNITTFGLESWGIFAQSVGGGGGNASWDSLTQGGEGGNIGIVIGREGGTGGSAGAVSVASDGEIRTYGDRSHGIFAQSIGNGGGNSGTFGVTVARSGSEDQTGNSLGMKVGLEGGDGGSAGAVSVTADGLVFTQGDDARGIFAQSVGGGGGTGGSAGGGAAGANANSYSISVGGTGGSGGLSGTVTVTSVADIGTLGDRSEGIFAQSVGGGGGTGGAVSSGQTTLDILKNTVKGSATGTTVMVNIGGSGGTGMTGGAVTVSSAGMIATLGEGSHGIRAQSVGGGGGDSGLVENQIVNLRSTVDTTVNIAIGGTAGSGAAGGTVDVANTGGILTAGDRAAGIVAQSVGGGGGNAGHVRNIIVGAEAANSTRNAFLIGGSGGTGGIGGAVTVTNAADAVIWTEGAESHGIFAQSVGGGGGSGSDVQNFSLVTKGSGDTAQSLNLAIGGSGGTGGAGGAVTVTNAGLIHTEGARAHGIIAQSVGGGGGNGGTTITGTVRLKPGTEADPSIALALGGSGGTGGVGGAVNVTNSGAIEVLGDGAFGILAQSVGGGGGNGGMAVSLTLSGLATLTDPTSQLTKVALGGSGGTGADGGDVTVTNEGSIYVGGDNGYGILAQSVGGGGGNAGLSVSTSLLSVADSIFNTALGARDGTSGTAGNVTVNSTGNIVMEGAGGQAILAQSVNGGGGNVDVFLDFAPVGEDEEPASGVTDILYNLAMGAVGLKDGAAGSDVSQTHEGGIAAAGAGSTGAQVQSIGGGGGNARLTVLGTGDNGFDFSAVLGAVDTDNAGGGNLSGSHTGDITTTGGQSTGALGQSIGGGGGSLLIAASGGTGHVTLGADPSFFNAGGAIDRSFDGNVTTTDAQSIAHLVQSIGAGGGNSLITGLDSFEAVLGATDDSSGDGGAVIYAINGDVLTLGDRSHGVVLQSIGGGGGLVVTDLAAVDVTVSLRNDNRGSGGAITLTGTGHVAVEGADAVGILAQSLGGGGGAVDAVFRGSAGGAGSGGAISLTQTGNVMATGEGGIAVMAQSAGKDGAGNITVALDGVIIGGSGNGGPGAAGEASGSTAAIVIDGGAVNRVTLGGNSFLMALNDRILSGGAGDDAVTLSGGGVGNVDLGAGSNSFTIAEGASFTALDRVLLGDDGLWQVDGDLFLGGAAYLTEGDLSFDTPAGRLAVTRLVSQTTTVTGSLSFSDTATYSPDVYFLQSGAYGGPSDLITTTGDATIAGTVLPQLRLLERTLPLVIIDTDGTSTDNGTTITGTPVLTYSIGLNGPTGDGSTIDLLVSADFTMDGMTNNQRRTALQFNHILEGQGSQVMGPMFTLIALMEDEADIIDAIDRLGSEDYAATLVESRGALLQFSDEMLTCERELPDGGCSWLRLQGHELTYGANDEWRSLGSHSRGLSGGVRVPLRDDLAIGLGARIEEFSMTSGTRFRAEGARLSLGVSLMRTVGPWTIYGMATGSSGSYKTERVIGITGELIDGTPVEAGTVTARQDVTSLNLRAGVTYDADLGHGYYLQPGVRIDATHLHSDAATEAGSDYGLVLAGTNQWVTTLTPSIEFGFGQATASGGNLRAYGRLEVSLADRDSLFIDATFPGASLEDGLFMNDSQFGRETWRAELGTTYTSGDGTRFVNAAVRHEWGNRGSSDSLSISAGFKF